MYDYDHAVAIRGLVVVGTVSVLEAYMQSDESKILEPPLPLLKLRTWRHGR